MKRATWDRLPVWVRDTLERAWWSFLATFLAVSGYQAGAHISDVDWLTSIEVAGMATLFSTAKSTVVAHLKNVGTDGTASAIDLEPIGKHRKP